MDAGNTGDAMDKFMHKLLDVIFGEANPLNLIDINDKNEISD